MLYFKQLSKIWILLFFSLILLSACNTFSSSKGILIIYFSNSISQNSDQQNINGSITISSIKVISENTLSHYSVNSEKQIIDLLPVENSKDFIGNIELNAEENYTISFNIVEIELITDNKKILPAIFFHELHIKDQFKINSNEVNFITIELDLLKSIILVNNKYYLLPLLNITKHGIEL